MKFYTLAPMERPAVHLVDRAFEGIEPGWLPWPDPAALAESVRRWITTSKPEVGHTPGDLRAVPVRGPWLVGLDDEARPMARWVAAPADAWLASVPGAKGLAARTRIVPRARSESALSDLPPERLPLGLATGLARGPAADPVAWWRWEDLLAWLAAPEDTDHVQTAHLGLPPFALAAEGPVAWVRQAADWRAITGPVALVAPPPSTPRFGPRGDTTLRLAVGFAVDARLDVAWLQVGATGRPFALDEDDAALRAEADGLRLRLPEVAPPEARVRVVLLSPGAFAAGALPDGARLAELGVRLVAAAVGRPQRAPGWDAEDGRHQPCRRLAPAGSVYWLDVLDGDAAAWARAHQFDSLCDLPQDRVDGLGQFVVGVA